MPTWSVGLAYCFLYVATTMFVPKKKRGRGYVTRLAKKIIPPKLFWKTGEGACMYRYWLWACATISLNYSHVVSNQTWEFLFWPVVIGLHLDDLLNGDDDVWKLLKNAVNNIKWKMDLPPRPAGQEVA